MITTSHDYSSVLVPRECKGGCGVKFKVLPTSNQWYARGNCATYCKDRIDVEVPSSSSADSIQSKPARIEPPSETKIQTKEKDIMQTVAEQPKEKKAVRSEADNMVSLEKSRKKPERKAQEKSVEKRKSSESGLVDRFDSRLKRLWDSSLVEAKKLMQKSDVIANRMGLAYLCLTDIRLHGDENRNQRIKKFSSAIGVEPNVLEDWVTVRSMIWDKTSDHESIEKYAFEDLLNAAGHIRSDMKQDEVRKVIEDKINGKYIALIKHYDESLSNIVHFYEKFSLDFMTEEQFDKTYETIKNLSHRFKTHSDRLRNRKLRVKKEGKS